MLNPILVEAIRASIATYGQLQPILVSEDGAIIDGHHRAEACRQLSREPLRQVVAGEPDLVRLHAHIRRQQSPLDTVQAIEVLRREFGDGKLPNGTGRIQAVLARELQTTFNLDTCARNVAYALSVAQMNSAGRDELARQNPSTMSEMVKLAGQLGAAPVVAESGAALADARVFRAVNEARASLHDDRPLAPSTVSLIEDTIAKLSERRERERARAAA